MTLFSRRSVELPPLDSGASIWRTYPAFQDRRGAHGWGSASSTPTSFESRRFESRRIFTTSLEEVSSYPVEDLTPFIRDVSLRPVKHGGPSDIYSGTCRVNGRDVLVALKVHRVAGTANDKIIKRLRKEIVLWRSVEHPCIQPFFGLHWGDGADLPALVSPWCEYGDINSYLQHRAAILAPLDLDALKLDLLVDVVEGLLYLHSCSVVHADIKGGNVLVSNNGVARLSDFGFSAVLAEHTSVSESEALRGTIRWMSPELLAEDNARHTQSSDIWACGCLFLEVQSGKAPHWDIRAEMGVILAISRKARPCRPPNVSDALWRTVLACCTADPAGRPTAVYLCQRMRLLRLLAGSYGIQRMILTSDIVSFHSLLRDRASFNEVFNSDEAYALHYICTTEPSLAVTTFCKADKHGLRSEPSLCLTDTMRLCIRIAHSCSPGVDDASLVLCTEALTVALALFPYRERYPFPGLQPLYEILASRNSPAAPHFLPIFASSGPSLLDYSVVNSGSSTVLGARTASLFRIGAGMLLS